MSKLASGPAKPPEPAPPPAYGKAAMVDLADHIEWSSSEVLNAAGSSSLQNVLKQGTREQKEMLLESDADEQLLLKIAFKSLVKIESLLVDAPEDGRAPLSLKLLVGRPALGFEDAEALPAEQELELTPESLGQRLDLKLVKFTNVERLNILVPGNQGDAETSALSQLRLWGAPVSTTNISDFKRVSGKPNTGGNRPLSS
jgi:hypothetical protein